MQDCRIAGREGVRRKGEGAKARGEFCVRAAAAGAAIVSGDSKPGAGELSGEGVARWRAWQSVYEVENGDSESFRADFQVFRGLVHAAG